MYISTAIIKELAIKHINRYSFNLEIANDPDHPRSKNINKHDTQMYLDIWNNILAKDCNWNKLTTAEKFEIEDALSDEIS